MGWSYYISYTRTFGIMFYDIKFKGERILYELSLQEALAQYAGNQPKAAGTTYHDTYYSLGTDMFTLVEGFDCSFGATFLNVSYNTGNATTVNPNAICIFEQDSGYPLSRHIYSGGNTSYSFTRLGVTKGAALITRAIATIGNYDYMFDYKFHQDGSLEVVVRASGYLQSSFYYPDQGKYGPRIQAATQGSLHDHILNFKADFDILGTANSFQVSDLVVVNQTQPWFPELGEFEQMELDIKNLETETAFDYAGNGQALYVVLNEDEENAWGEKRGYRILPGRSNVHLTPLSSPFSLKNAEFAKHHLAVTRQHDNEPYSNSFQNVNLPWKPQQDYSKFFDDESIVQEDLVVWFNLGMHHFVRSEGTFAFHCLSFPLLSERPLLTDIQDIPVTLYTEAYSSIIFAPQNFFDRAQDGDLLNRRWITVNQTTEELTYETYNVSLPSCPVNLAEPVDLVVPQATIRAEL
jgi:primary-amine oxidase